MTILAMTIYYIRDEDISGEYISDGAQARTLQQVVMEGADEAAHFTTTTTPTTKGVGLCEDLGLAKGRGHQQLAIRSVFAGGVTRARACSVCVFCGSGISRGKTALTPKAVGKH
jgi:hypothetical protein